MSPPARAYENQVYTAYANHSGDDDGLSYVGLSSLCGPDGAMLAMAGRGEEMLYRRDRCRPPGGGARGRPVLRRPPASTLPAARRVIASAEYCLHWPAFLPILGKNGRTAMMVKSILKNKPPGFVSVPLDMLSTGILALLAEKQIGAVLVLEGRAAARHRERARFRALPRPPRPGGAGDDGGRADDHQPTTGTPETTVEQAMAMMTRGISAISRSSRRATSSGW